MNISVVYFFKYFRETVKIVINCKFYITVDLNVFILLNYQIDFFQILKIGRTLIQNSHFVYRILNYYFEFHLESENQRSIKNYIALLPSSVIFVQIFYCYRSVQNDPERNLHFI